jgi:hypothetical protein
MVETPFSQEVKAEQTLQKWKKGDYQSKDIVLLKTPRGSWRLKKSWY